MGNINRGIKSELARQTVLSQRRNRVEWHDGDGSWGTPYPTAGNTMGGVWEQILRRNIRNVVHWAVRLVLSYGTMQYWLNTKHSHSGATAACVRKDDLLWKQVAHSVLNLNDGDAAAGGAPLLPPVEPSGSCNCQSGKS